MCSALFLRGIISKALSQQTGLSSTVLFFILLFHFFFVFNHKKYDTDCNLNLLFGTAIYIPLPFMCCLYVLFTFNQALIDTNSFLKSFFRI